MDFATGTPSEEALSQLIKSLIEFLEEEKLAAPIAELEAANADEEEAAELLETNIAKQKASV